MHAGFGFAAAEEQVPYLAALGVSHLYLSPILEAVEGSLHGYDVLDHTEVSSALGGERALLSLAGTAHGHGLGVVVDVVPNHMAFVAPEHASAPLWQVLREGRDAETAHWFDIDWDAGAGRLGVPVLGGPLREVLESGELTLDTHAGGPVVRYYDHVFAVRVELPDVFEATHRKLLDLNHRGVVDGFRIDHPDGLADPEGYLVRLRAATRPGTVIWVEKILEGDDRLPTSWACEGTTGHDAARAVSTALVDPPSAPVLDRTWKEAGGDLDLHRVIDVSKRQVVEEMLGAEVERLTRSAAGALPRSAVDRLRQAVTELLVAGEVYRAYLQPGVPLTTLARQRLQDARNTAIHIRPDLEVEIDGLVGLAAGTHDHRDAADFAVRLQQTWGPVMAKGIEDTAFYRWHRLVALNEVGGDPSDVADARPDVLHPWAEHQQRDWPRGMTTLSTHDTKRSEDMRSRLLAIAGDTAAWARCSEVFAEAADAVGVDRPTAHQVWQPMAGVGDISAERLHGYLTKAVREAKLHTAWVDGDEGYEAAVLALADRATAPGALRDTVDAAVAENESSIRATVLGAKLLQLMLPGVPDVYQGCEIVDLSLVDPDNRRPVDFADRASRLARVDDPAAGGNLTGLDDEKLLVTSRALRIRRENPELFDEW